MQFEGVRSTSQVAKNFMGTIFVPMVKGGGLPILSAMFTTAFSCWLFCRLLPRQFVCLSVLQSTFCYPFVCSVYWVCSISNQLANLLSPLSLLSLSLRCRVGATPLQPGGLSCNKPNRVDSYSIPSRSNGIGMISDVSYKNFWRNRLDLKTIGSSRDPKRNQRSESRLRRRKSIDRLVISDFRDYRHLKTRVVSL
jgi:hypothetical protein